MANLTIQPGTRANPNAGFFEFSTGAQVEVKVKVKPGKSPQAKPAPATNPPQSSGKFTLSRVVINLEVSKAPGEKSPIELRVRKRGNENSLAYLSNNKWEVLPTTLQEGFLVASHPDWPSDPAVGIGQSS
jgi:hypothetical protein